jgi:murein DD-endopeptidase MepM/ murein hydrolase activator NlpD
MRVSALRLLPALCVVAAAAACAPRTTPHTTARSLPRSPAPAPSEPGEQTGDAAPLMRATVSPYHPRTQPVAASGALVIPVQGVTAVQLRDTFGDARDASRRHGAIDIMAPRGTPVLAAGAGTIVALDNSARGGISIYELAPDRRTIYFYGHLQKYADGMAEGRHVEAGDVIGYVGDTGNAGIGNYHLHFEINTTTDPRRYWGGEQINPYPLLREGITR